MAKQTQRPAPKSKPITSNPLFPAVVALWFGALFGLSSLAVRVSVIETLVMKSGIDLIVPAAAPPLGITARILVALVLAALGAIVGTVIGRRLGRPKVEVRERTRNAKASDAAEPSLRNRDSHPDAPARKPISAHEEFGEDPVRVAAPAGPGALANRRRALTAEPEPAAFVPQELAPLPGGDPQILDLAGAEIDIAATSAPPSAEPPTTDLNAFVTEAVLPEPAPAAPDRALEAAAQDLSFGGPSNERQVFHAPAFAADADPADLGAPLPTRQIFGQEPVEPPHPDDRQVFGSTSNESTVTLEGIKAAHVQASVFDTPPSPPLFAGRDEPAAIPVSFEASAATVALSENSVPTAPEPLPSIADLGMTDLAIRLQESMKRRRAARALAAAVTIGSEPVAAVESAPAATPLPRLSLDPVAETAPTSSANSQASFAPPPPSAFPVADELPPALRPLALDAFDDDEDDDTLASLLLPRHIAMPPVAVPATERAASPTAAASDDEMAEDLQGDYASLLNVAPVAGRPSFVRVQEPEDEDLAVEPVVIFPGQGPRVPLSSLSADAAQDVAPVVSPSLAEPASFRRFDAPPGAAQGQPISAQAAAPALDPDEAERSLRSALANLQRISGAA